MAAEDAREVDTLRRWVNSLSDADYNKLRDNAAYNFPRSLADTMEPGRLLEAWQQTLKTGKSVTLDPDVDYSGTINRTEKQLNEGRRSEALRVEPNPSAAQIEAGNYKKGHRTVDGIRLTLENLKGGIRRGIDALGRKWQAKMGADYGYIKKTRGRGRRPDRRL